MNPPEDLKRAHFCADDWGMSPAINEGILLLIRFGIVKRVSLLATSRFLEEGVHELKKFPVQIGLHWDLLSAGTLFDTESTPGRLFAHALARKISAERLRESLVTQLARLQKLHLPLSHMDSHLHMHMLPGVMQKIIPVLQQQGIRKVRFPYDPRIWLSGKFPLNLCACLQKRVFQEHQLEYLPFRYVRKSGFQSSEALIKSLNFRADHEVMVHPAIRDDFERYGIRDPYRQRVIEYRALLGLVR